MKRFIYRILWMPENHRLDGWEITFLTFIAVGVLGLLGTLSIPFFS